MNKCLGAYLRLLPKGGMLIRRRVLNRGGGGGVGAIIKFSSEGSVNLFWLNINSLLFVNTVVVYEAYRS